MKPTWTLLPDIEDPPPRPCQVEQMQADYLKRSLTREGSWGELAFWDWLEGLKVEDGIRS